MNALMNKTNFKAPYTDPILDIFPWPDVLRPEGDSSYL